MGISEVKSASQNVCRIYIIKHLIFKIMPYRPLVQVLLVVMYLEVVTHLLLISR